MRREQNAYISVGFIYLQQVQQETCLVTVRHVCNLKRHHFCWLRGDALTASPANRPSLNPPAAEKRLRRFIPHEDRAGEKSHNQIQTTQQGKKEGMLFSIKTHNKRLTVQIMLQIHPRRHLRKCKQHSFRSERDQSDWLIPQTADINVKDKFNQFNTY